MAEAFVSRIRFTLLVVATLAGFGSVLTRLVYLHILEKPAMEVMVAANRQREARIPAQRGSIVDSRHNLLAFTRTLWTVGLDPVVARARGLQEPEVLAGLLGIDPAGVRAALGEATVGGAPKRWVKLADRVDDEVYNRVLAGHFPGVYGNPHHVRVYPGETLAAHVLGYVNAEGVGTTGVEQALDYYLRGQVGWREYERDGRGGEVTRFRSREIPPEGGLNVELTLDLMIQHLAEEACGWAWEEYQPKGVTILVSEPRTGFLLALANLPHFDPNRYGEAPMEALRNRALTDVYEPGSTFKIVPAGGALDLGLVHPEDRFRTGDAVVEYRGRKLRLPGDHKPHDELTMWEVVVKSSNRGAAHLGMAMGEERLFDYARAFGFGEETGLGLGGETSGVLHPVARWDGLTLTRLPMGHAVSATPLQVHMSMSVLANEGILMQPRVVRRIFSQGGATVALYEPLARRRVLRPETVELLDRMLVGVVSPDGTASSARIEGFEVAGKTGTTQKLVNGTYSRQHHVASFSGFFPADEPRLVITVVVDEPDFGKTGYGGVVAGPVFQRIGTAAAAYLGIAPRREEQAAETLVARAKGGRNGASR